MTGQVFAAPVTCYRFGDANGSYPIFSYVGASRADGRWHTKDFPLIYTGHNYATSMLESLAHHSGKPPRDQHYVEILIPNGASYEVFRTTDIPDWFTINHPKTAAFGSAWVQEMRSLVLIVPSAVAHVEKNFLINPFHPEFAAVKTGLHQPVYWDSRLFR